jgi:hypothetical protein
MLQAPACMRALALKDGLPQFDLGGCTPGAVPGFLLHWVSDPSAREGALPQPQQPTAISRGLDRSHQVGQGALDILRHQAVVEL